MGTTPDAGTNQSGAERLGLLTPVLVVLLALVVWPYAGFESQREIVSAYRDSMQRDLPLIYFRQRPYSAEFYSQGSAREIDDAGQLRQSLAKPNRLSVATRQSYLEQLPDDLRAQLTTIATSHQYVLLRHEPVVPPRRMDSPSPDRAGGIARARRTRPALPEEPTRFHARP